MTYRNLVSVDGKVVELSQLPKEETKRLAEAWTRKAAETLNYKEDKAAE